MRYKKNDLERNQKNYVVPDDYWNEHLILKNCAIKLQKLKVSVSKAKPALDPKILDCIILAKLMNKIVNNYKNRRNDQSLKIGADIGKSLIQNVPPLDEFSAAVSSILTEYDLQDTNDDFLGFLYQLLQNQHGRKTDGQFYTPREIVKNILSEIALDPDRDEIIMDPACGSGQFLLETFNELDSLLPNSSDKSEKYRRILDKIVGVDVDRIACQIAKFNLLKRSCFLYPAEPKILCTNTLKKTNGLFDEAPLQHFENKVDVIIGNPPWGAKLSKEEKDYFKSNYSIGKVGLNTFTLFIERSLELLKTSGGKLGFLIPEAYLKIKNHQLSRKQLLKKTKIKSLKVCGDVFKKVYAPALILILETSKPDQRLQKHQVKATTSINEDPKHIPQKVFHFTHENIFNINYTPAAESLKNKIRNQQNIKYLKDNAIFFLGIVTGNNKKHLHKNNGFPNASPILVGKDVKKYKINFSQNYFTYDKEQLQQVAPKDYYLKPEKLLYKFISSKLVFAYDNKPYFMLNNINAVIPNINQLQTKFILALLNSNLMQYYYASTFFTVKVLRGNLEKLPLKIIPSNKQLEIINLVKNIESANGENEFKEQEKHINEAVYAVYNLTGKEIDFVEKELATNGFA